MKKSNSKKIISFVIIHIIELLILIAAGLFVYTYAPEEFQTAMVVFIIGIYGLYLAGSIVEDYREYKGGDFIIDLKP